MPHLTLGQILFEPQSQLYWVCVHPKCDSIRIKPNKPMRETKDRTSDSHSASLDIAPIEPAVRDFLLLKCDPSTKDEPHDYVVQEKEGTFVHLKVSLKLHDSSLVPFKADLSIKKVIPSENEGMWIFKSENSNEYRWTAQLKTESAQELTNRFASEISRVALNKTEWLRRTKEFKSKETPS